MSEGDAAAHPIWSDGPKVVKEEFQRMREERSHWQSLYSCVDSEAERLQTALEEIASRDEGRCSEIASEALRKEGVPNA